MCFFMVGYVFSHNEARTKLFERWGELTWISIMDGKKYNLSIYGKHQG